MKIQMQQVIMDKLWHRCVIMYLHKKRTGPKEILAEKVATLGNDTLALGTVQKWARVEGRVLNISQSLKVLQLPSRRKH